MPGRASDLQVWGTARESAFLTSSPVVMMMMVAQRHYFGKCRCCLGKDMQRALQDHREWGERGRERVFQGDGKPLGVSEEC